MYSKPFQFLRINTLREYLAKEMDQGANYSCVGGFDLERVLDDFVFMVRAGWRDRRRREKGPMLQARLAEALCSQPADGSVGAVLLRGQ